MESEKLVLKSGNNLPDPQVGAYYLPFGNHATGDYSEFQIAQSFEFPTVYGARSNLIETQVSQNELRYKLKRQEVLLPAVQLLHQLVFLDKKRTIEMERTVQAKTVYTQLQELFDLEQIGILEVNKGKIAWIQEQFKIDQLDADKKNILLQLQSLNGGKEIQFDPRGFIESLEIAPQDSIWASKKYTDPELLLLYQKEVVAKQQIQLSKNQILPNLTAGYIYQGVA
jgi:outer membrane protein TolC